MASIHRKLLPEPKPKSDYPSPEEKHPCKNLPPPLSPSLPTTNPPLPPPPRLFRSSSNQKHLPSNLIISLSTGLSLFVLGFIALFLWRRYLRNSREDDDNWSTSDDTDEEGFTANNRQNHHYHHHVWLMNTMDLQQSVIDSIAVCKYKTGDGLIEGTECSVCLSEFQEDETLRLLPKCSHAFHFSCIDPWLRSHKNCPLCRAPIVIDSEPKSNDSSSMEETQMENLENNSGSSEIEIDISVSSEENGGEGGQRMRNSISSDSGSVQENEEGSGEDTQVVVELKESNLGLEVVEKKKQRSGNSSLLCYKLMHSSSLGRRSLQMGTVSMKRSFSSGRLLFVSRQKRRQCHSSSSILPV